MNTQRYHESKQRGSPDFPLDYHYVDEHHNRYEMPYHWHEEIEILHVLRGSFALAVGQEIHMLKAGDVAYIASGCLHGGEPKDCVYECVVFDMRLLLKSNDHCKQYISEVLEGRIDITPHLMAGSKVTRHTIEPMFDALREQCDGYALITLGCLFQFVGEVYKYGAYTVRTAPYENENLNILRLKRVFELIENQYAEALSLRQLSMAVSMTPKYFCRFFKDATHRTPMDYIAYYRVEMACYTLATTSKSVTEVALDMGYADPNYFIRCFKKYKGITPGRYRQTLRLKSREADVPKNAAEAYLSPPVLPTPAGKGRIST